MSDRPRRLRRARTALSVVTLAAGAVVAAPALAETSDAEVTVNAGSLSLVTPSFQTLSVTLTGAAQTVATTPASEWSAVDARGTGAAWSVVASASDLVSTGAPNRVIPSANLAITTGAVTAATGADPVGAMTGATDAAFTQPTGAGQTNVTVLDAPGPHRGAYTFTPSLGITIPADAAPSHAGSPYTATVTLTIS